MTDLPNRGNDRLSELLEMAYHNNIACSVQKRFEYGQLAEILDLYLAVFEHIQMPSEETWIPGLFFQRVESAYFTSTRLATSGHVCEAYMTIRGCLELVLLAYHFFKCSNDFELWAARHDDEESFKKVRKNFLVGELLNELENDHERIGKIARKIYETTNDLGAHANIDGFVTSMKTRDDGHQTLFEFNLFNCGSLAQDVCLRNVMYVGTCALEIFGLIFKTRFEIADLVGRAEAIGRRYENEMLARQARLDKQSVL